MQIITEHSHVQWGVGLVISSGRWRDVTVKMKKSQTRTPTTTGKLVIPSISEITMSKDVGLESLTILFNVVR